MARALGKFHPLTVEKGRKGRPLVRAQRHSLSGNTHVRQWRLCKSPTSRLHRSVKKKTPPFESPRRAGHTPRRPIRSAIWWSVRLRISWLGNRCRIVGKQGSRRAKLLPRRRFERNREIGMVKAVCPYVQLDFSLFFRDCNVCGAEIWNNTCIDARHLTSGK